MESATIVVLVMTFAWFAFAVYAEINSRRNTAKLKAASSAKTEPDQQSSARPLEAGRRKESTRAKAS
jgi:hypothetical protein